MEDELLTILNVFGLLYYCLVHGQSQPSKSKDYWIKHPLALTDAGMISVQASDVARMEAKTSQINADSLVREYQAIKVFGRKKMAR